MSEGKISFMIGCGWAAAGIGALAGALYGHGSHLAYTIALAFFVLAIGIFLRIDWCAVIALVVFVGLRIQFYEVAVAMQQRAGNGQVIIGFWISVILFTQLYVLGVIGTLLHNRRHPEIRYSLASLLLGPRGEISPSPERQNPRSGSDRQP
jgi:hypothetical protein